MTERHMRWGAPPRGPVPGESRGIGGFMLTPWVKRLLIANLVIHLATSFGLPPRGLAVEWFGFSGATVLTRPWTPLTYMFLHGDFGHLFVNMLTVFFFGPQLERHWGGRYFIKYYLISGLGGALIAVVLFPWFGSAVVIGASGAVFGLLLAFALNWPNAPIYLYFVLPVKAKWFVGVLGAFTLYATFAGSGGAVAHWAHLGGLVTGFIYLRLGDRIGRGMSRIFWKEKAVPVKVEPGGRVRSKRPPRRPRKSVDGDALDEVDRILDKIRASGMDSLTQEERAFLDDMSKKYKRAT